MEKEIAIGCDHAGYELKEHLKTFLTGKGYQIIDLGTNSLESVDYPDYGKKVAEWAAKESKPAIVICGTGIGMCMSANKVHGIRAALAHDHYTAEMSRKHNDANVLCMGGRTTSPAAAEDIALTFLETDFEGGRHERRVNKIDGQ